MFAAETLWIPGLIISTIAAAPSRLFYNISMPLMVAVFKAFQANDAGAVHSAIKALNNIIPEWN